MNIDKERIEKIFGDCFSATTCQNVDFTTWEQDFLESAHEQFVERGTLTSKQVDVLMRIWDKI